MRVPGTILSTLALLLGFYEAPFAHIHADDFDQSAASGLTHWHQPAPIASPALRAALTADDDAVDVGWHAVRSAHAQVSLHLAVAGPVRLPEATIRSTPLTRTHRRGHDPPEQNQQPPRSPPS
ncbi:MAG TPA: hypothetical protein VF146_13110 [Bryobacteraceae bacterium]